jgi:hypothetical protein
MRDDKIAWRFGKKGLFSVKPVYNALTVNEAGRFLKMIWKGKIPEKLKMFLWMAINNAILKKKTNIRGGATFLNILLVPKFLATKQLAHHGR